MDDFDTATNPQTGAKMAHINGAWTPIEASATNPQTGAKMYKQGGKWQTVGGQQTPSEMLEKIQPSVKSTYTEPSLGAKLTGAGEAATSMTTGIPAGIAGNVAGVGSRMMGNTMQQAGKTADEVSQAMTYQPPSQMGQEMAQNVGDVLGSLPPVMGEIPAMRAGAKGVATGAQAGMQATKEAATKPFRLSPQTIALAKKAEQFGIPLRPDMLTDNTIVRMVGEALEKVPLSGAKSKGRTEAFNKAVMKTIGADENAKKLTPDVFDKAMDKSGSTIGDIAERSNIVLDKDLYFGLNKVVSEADKFAVDDVSKIIKNYMEEVTSKVDSGQISGKAFREIDSKLGRQLRSSGQNGDLVHYLDQFQEVMRDSLTRNVSAKDAAALVDARRKYAYAKVLVPLVAKSVEGDISPAGLMGRVTSTGSQKEMVARGRGGELVDLAKVGQRFLKEPPSSGTAERNVAYGLLGGAGYAHPLMGAGIYGLANAYNRLAPSATKKIIDAQEK